MNNEEIRILRPSFYLYCVIFVLVMYFWCDLVQFLFTSFIQLSVFFVNLSQEYITFVSEIIY